MNCEHCNMELTEETKCTCTPDSMHCKECHKDEAAEGETPTA